MRTNSVILRGAEQLIIYSLGFRFSKHYTEFGRTLNEIEMRELVKQLFFIY